MNELINLIFVARDISHRQHLTTKSFAVHVALQKFYEDLPDIADRLAEAYQGTDSLEFNESNIDLPSDSPLSTISSFIDKANKLKSVLNSRSELEAIHDDLIELAQSTLYKLKNLS